MYRFYYREIEGVLPIAMKRLDKSELVVYLVHDNEFVRNIAKGIYDRTT